LVDEDEDEAQTKVRFHNYSTQILDIN
jgi:hypothetical protein